MTFSNRARPDEEIMKLVDRGKDFRKKTKRWGKMETNGSSSGIKGKV